MALLVKSVKSAFRVKPDYYGRDMHLPEVRDPVVGQLNGMAWRVSVFRVTVPWADTSDV